MIVLNKNILLLALVLALVFGLGFFAGFYAKTNLKPNHNPNQSHKKTIGLSGGEEVADLEPQFRVLNYRFDRETDFAYLRGEVKNIGTNTLRNIEI